MPRVLQINVSPLMMAEWRHSDKWNSSENGGALADALISREDSHEKNVVDDRIPELAVCARAG